MLSAPTSSLSDVIPCKTRYLFRFFVSSSPHHHVLICLNRLSSTLSCLNSIEKILLATPFFLLPRPAPGHSSLSISTPHFPSFLPSQDNFFSITPLSFPPSPGLTIALIPLANVVYSAFKRVFGRWLLYGGTWGSSGSRPQNESLSEVFGRVGGVEIGLVDAREQQGTVAQGPVQPPQTANNVDPLLAQHPETLYLNRLSVSRLAVGALIFPVCANLTGQALLALANASGNRRFKWALGVSVGRIGLSTPGSSRGGGVSGGWEGLWNGLGLGGESRSRLGLDLGLGGNRWSGAGDDEFEWWRTAIGGLVFQLIKELVSNAA